MFWVIAGGLYALCVFLAFACIIVGARSEDRPYPDNSAEKSESLTSKGVAARDPPWGPLVPQIVGRIVASIVTPSAQRIEIIGEKRQCSRLVAPKEPPNAPPIGA